MSNEPRKTMAKRAEMERSWHDREVELAWQERELEQRAPSRRGKSARPGRDGRSGTATAAEIPAPPTGSSEHPGVPAAWLHFQKEFADAAVVLAEGRESAHRARKRVEQRIEELRAELEEPLPTVGVSEHLPKSMANGIRNAIAVLRGQQRKLLDALAQMAEAFESAEENEDRFVVLVFGEVNAGKSALANHVAGLDFEAAPVQGAAFVGSEAVSRLAELPIECTRQYQGFRLPGLLWIDCPGVLSGTFANAQLARRLVARADFLLFVSSSDAPFKASEMKELAALIDDAGQEKLDACLVVTKADHFDVDEDPDSGREIRRVIPKGAKDWEAQANWCREQLKSTGLGKRVRVQAPLAVSVYVGRDALGRRWEDGSRFRSPGPGWESAYAASGLPTLFDLLSKLVREHGPQLKEQWPRKRAAALNKLFEETAARSAAEIDRLVGELKELRSQLALAEKAASAEAAQRAASKVGACLTAHGIYRSGQFDEQAARRDLRQVLRASVRDAVTEATRSVLDQARRRFDDALAIYVQNTNFTLDVRDRFKTHTYYTTKKAEAVAGAACGLAGALGGAALGSAIFPGVGTVAGFIGGLLGGLLGGTGGRAAARKWIREKVTVRVPAGTNGDEVIAETQERMRRLAQSAVKGLFVELESAVFDQLTAELKRLRRQVDRWRELAASSNPARSAGRTARRTSGRRRLRVPTARSRRRGASRPALGTTSPRPRAGRTSRRRVAGTRARECG